MRVKTDFGTVTMTGYEASGPFTEMSYRTDAGKEASDLFPLSKAIFTQAALTAGLDMGEMDMTSDGINKLMDNYNDDGTMRPRMATGPLVNMP